ncbi:MAG: hypothetical protein QOH06_4107 [Acidobacteriota bacterium]|nr:hypothetical protein [Acidobacteriota bacterium]
MTLASGLASRGHDVEVVSIFQDRTTPQHRFDPAVPVVALIDLRVFPKGLRIEPELPAGPPSAIVPAGHPMFAPYDRKTDHILGEYLASSSADVVISAWPVLHHFLAELAPASIVTVAHDHLLYHYHPLSIRAALRKAYAKIDCIVSVAAAAADGYRKQFPELEKKIHFIPNAVRSLGVPESTGEARLVVTAGRLDEMKRFDLLIEAFARVVREHPDWRLRIYGDGKEREKLGALIQELRLHDHVFLMGMVSPMEAEWVKGSIGVLTSEAESFGLVIPEAMQAGLPMISTDCPVGPRELIDHGVDGLLVQPGDVAAIASAIASLIESPAQRRIMAANAIKKADRFSAERIAAMHEELYSSLLHGKARTGRARPSPAGRGLAVTCTSKSATELELVVEGTGGADEALLTHARSGETLRIAHSGIFRIAVDDLPPAATGTWSLTVAGRAPHLKFIDNRRLVAELDARSGEAKALLPIYYKGTLRINAITEPSRAQLTDVSWAGEVLSLAGVLLGDGWPDMQVQIDMAAAGSRRFIVPCASHGEGFRCRVDISSAYALLGEGDGSWRVWLADAAEPSRRVRLGRVVSDLRDPGAVMVLPSVTVTEDAVRIRPVYSRTGLLTLEVEQVDERAALPETISISAETNSAGGGQI